MPESGAILWTIIGGSFTVMIAIVGWFLNLSAASVKDGMKDMALEVKGLRGDIARYHDAEMETRADLKAHIHKCEERHKNLAFYSMNQDRG